MSSTLRAVLRRALPRRVRNWLRSPARTAAWMRDAFRYRMGARPRLELHPGWSVICHPAAHRVLHAAQVDDPTQAAELADFLAHCEPRMRLFDLGAHYGVFSLAAAHFGGPDARAVAVEPSASAGAMLRVQARLNGVGERVEVVRAAVGAAEGTLRMLDVGVISDGYMVTGDEQDDRPDSEYTLVPLLTIDALTRTTGVEPTHVKIDVEGLEGDVIEGGREVLTRARPIVFLELHNDMVRAREGDPERPVRLLQEFGYAQFTLDGRSVSRREMTEPALVRITAQ